MSLSGFRFVLLFVAGLATTLVFANGLYDVYTDAGVSAPVMIQMSADSFETMGWIAFVAVGLAIVVSIYQRAVNTLTGIAITALLFGAFFEPMLTDNQTSLVWITFFGSLVGVVICYAGERFGLFKSLPAHKTRATS